MKKKLVQVIKDYIGVESSVRPLSIAACLGIYIAFSPFIGFHTLMTIVFSWLFSLNFFIMFTISSIINNPWTMGPVYGLDYIVGYWLLKLFGIDPMLLNPHWVDILNEHICYYTGLSGISFGAFMLGGNLLGVLFSVMLYPVMYAFFASWKRELSAHNNSNQK